jgi:hypothetical protein
MADNGHKLDTKAMTAVAAQSTLHRSKHNATRKLARQAKEAFADIGSLFTAPCRMCPRALTIACKTCVCHGASAAALAD